MKEPSGNGYVPIIAQAIEEMKAEWGDTFSLEQINLAELERRTGISRGKLRRLKKNGFQDSRRNGDSGKHKITKLTGYSGIIDTLLSHIHNQKEQIDIYLTPLIKEATLLSSSIRDVTDKKSIDVEIELDMAKKQFASFKSTALETKRIAESEIMGFEDFESILVHCQERIRVMVEANQNGEPLTPDEVSFLNTLNDSVCALVDALENDNGILRVTSTRQYSNVITAFVDAIRESEN